MASPNSSRRRRSQYEVDVESVSTHLAQASSPKRPRLDPADNENEKSEEEDSETSSSQEQDNNGEESDSESESVGAEIDEQESDAESNGSDASEVIAHPPQVEPHNGLGPGGYKPGAIVRIKVKNFVTYTSAEFFPGPKLNMVIGPNGTGKSTLVCAICLGLGWGPKVRVVDMNATQPLRSNLY